MFMIGGFNPEMPWYPHRVAEEYSRKLAQVGNRLCIGCGALFFVPLTQTMALLLACLLLSAAFIWGREYRRYVDEVIKQTSAVKLVRIFAPSWRYMLITTFLLGVGLGLSDWSYFTQVKQVLIPLIVSGGILDLFKAFFDSK